MSKHRQTCGHFKKQPNKHGIQKSGEMKQTEINYKKKKRKSYTDMWIYSEIYLEITQIQMKFS